MTNQIRNKLKIFFICSIILFTSINARAAILHGDVNTFSGLYIDQYLISGPEADLHVNESTNPRLHSSSAITFSGTSSLTLEGFDSSLGDLYDADLSFVNGFGSYANVRTHTDFVPCKPYPNTKVSSFYV